MGWQSQLVPGMGTRPEPEELSDLGSLGLLSSSSDPGASDPSVAKQPACQELSEGQQPMGLRWAPTASPSATLLFKCTPLAQPGEPGPVRSRRGLALQPLATLTPWPLPLPPPVPTVILVVTPFASWAPMCVDTALGTP